MRFPWYVWVMVYLTVFLGRFVHEADAAKVNIDEMTLDALQTLLDQNDLDGLEEVKKVTPLYRVDLPEDYVAYYEVEYKKEYYIISAGPETGDYDMVSRGGLPSPTKQCRDAAKKRHAKCFKYYVMTTHGDVMCSDKKGQFVATSIADVTLFADNADLPLDAMGERGKREDKRDFHIGHEFGVTTLDTYIRSKSDQQAMIFQEHSRKVSDWKNGNDEDEDVTLSPLRDIGNNLNEEFGVDAKRSDDDQLFLARAIIPGNVEQVAIGSQSKLLEVKVRYQVSDNDEQKEAGLKDHKKLCQVIRGCDTATVSEEYAVLMSEHVALHKVFIELELLPETEKKFKEEEFVFAVDIVRNDGKVHTLHFGVMYQDQTEKRWTQYTSWSSWQYWWIGRHYLFPVYNQFIYGNCYVGCGPVAWAMVFAYYDRRAHYGWDFCCSERLYSNSYDGTYGDWKEIAPWTEDWRMKNYIRHINGVVKTFCKGIGGATWTNDMHRVGSFFWWRQYGSPSIIQSWWNNYWVRDRLVEHWPVVVAWKVDAYSWHYPVATGLANQYRWYRICFWIFCGAWRKQNNYWMWLHMGWGLNSYGTAKGNKWARLDVAYGAAAIY